jgi:uncharacterized membrane protein
MNERNPVEPAGNLTASPDAPPSLTSDRPDRIVMFSDGVFAIAVTLLALDLIPSEVPKTVSIHDLLWERSDRVICFFISFWVISLYWMAHVRMYRWIDRADNRLFMLNLASLMLVTFLPYPTALLAEFTTQTASVVFYALAAAAAGLMQTAMWIYASSGGRLISADTPPAFIRMFTVRGFTVAGIFVASCGVAVYDPGLATMMWIAIPFALALMRRATLRKAEQA